MEVLFFLIPISLVLAGGGLVSCVWAIRNGQFDDLQSPAQRLVLEDQINTVSTQPLNQNSHQRTAGEARDHDGKVGS